MPLVYKEVEVEVELDDFDTDDLIEELESRGEFANSTGSTSILRTVYNKRRLGKDYQQELDELIYSVLGRIV